MAVICLDFKLLGFRISKPIQNPDNLQFNLFQTIQNSAKSEFQIPLYYVWAIGAVFERQIFICLQALEKRLNIDTEGACQALQIENVTLRRQLEKFKASLNLRDQEIQLLRQFDEEDKFNSPIAKYNPENFVKNEQFK